MRKTRKDGESFADSGRLGRGDGRDSLRATLAGSLLLVMALFVSIAAKIEPVQMEWSPYDPRSEEAKAANNARAEGDRHYTRGTYSEAEKAYLEVIAGFRDSEDPDVQDQVGLARLRVGYIAGKASNFKAAQSWFDEAATEYKGRGGVDPAFGSIPDQGAYQAAVSLAAQGKTQDAERAFLAFIRERQLSPLVHAAFNRLVRLNGNKPKPEYEELLQQAVTAQERHVALESAMCGPKAICHLVKLLGRTEPDYHDVAVLCKTSDKGTTIQDLRHGLKELGLPSYGYRVNRRDVHKIPLPAITLIDGHFVVLTWIARTKFGVYDPLYRSEREIQLPSIQDTQFTLDVITLKLLREEKE